MYLSRIALDPSRRNTARALVSPQVLHGAVEASFPNDPSMHRLRSLWRIDHLSDRCYLLVLSSQQPDLSSVAEQFGYNCDVPRWETKSYATHISQLQTGEVFRFRLRANPVRSSFAEKDERSGRGKVFAHVTAEQQKDWLLGRAPEHGFALDIDKFDVVHSEWLSFRKAGARGSEVSLRVAEFEGLLTITNVEQFRAMLTQGLGRAKAYGCGLLTVIRCQHPK